MGTSKFPSYRSPEPGADTYIPNYSWRHRMNPVQPEPMRENAKILNVISRTLLRGIGIIKSVLCGLFCK